MHMLLNLLFKIDFKTTNINEFFEECQKDANEMQIATCGSEIVGLIPLESILMAADHYIEKEKLLVLEESQKVKLVCKESSAKEFFYFFTNKIYFFQ